MKSTLIYPVIRDATLTIHDISEYGLSGECSLTMSLHQQVHFSVDGEKFFTAEVRWLNGTRYGLQTEDSLAAFAREGEIRLPKDVAELRIAPRSTVNLSATLVTSAPVFAGMVRNMSAEGMMIEVLGLAEGTRVLVKARGCDVKMGRVKWSSGNMVGVFFEPACSTA